MELECIVGGCYQIGGVDFCFRYVNNIFVLNSDVEEAFSCGGFRPTHTGCVVVEQLNR